jgi:prepilin signal peptidase PulO-like enzyme (type II secretory pathway)
MMAATFTDIDETIIPDEITVPGTALGLALAAIVPMSLLPLVAVRENPPLVGVEIANVGGQRWWLEPATAASPREWPPEWGDAGDWRALVVALACYALWCFALARRVWREGRGLSIALLLIVRQVRRELSRPPLRFLTAVGVLLIMIAWGIGGIWPDIAAAAWAGLLSALIGLAGLGIFVWAVRVMCSSALRVEALGFGDVTLMMMIGTFVGWQAGVLAFFVAPFAGVVVGIAQYVVNRHNAIPFGPFLCLATATVVVAWSFFWDRLQLVLRLGWLVPAALVVCLLLMWAMLTLWLAIKTAIFGRRE